MQIFTSRMGVKVRNIVRYRDDMFVYEAQGSHGVWYRLDSKTAEKTVCRPNYLPDFDELEEFSRQQSHDQFQYGYNLVSQNPSELPIVGGNLTYPDALACAKHKLISNYPNYFTAIISHMPGTGSNKLAATIVYLGGEVVTTEYIKSE